jgi:hypothetical protein
VRGAEHRSVIFSIRPARRALWTTSAPLDMASRLLPQFLYQPLRAIVRVVLPSIVARRRAFQASEAARISGEIETAVVAVLGDRRVADGPFAGMRYVSVAAGSSLTPKLIGSYEAELVPFIELGMDRWRTVINVGCAEGYYAVGLARRLASATVVAYDADPRARMLCEEMARLNRVSDRVTVGSAVDAETLAAAVEAAGPGVVVICDCEGAELALLREKDTPRFAKADLLIEVHDFLSWRCGDEIARRFSRTHHVTRIPARPRSGGESVCAQRLPATLRRLALDEHRPAGMEWVVCVPRAGQIADSVRRQAR